MTEDEVKAPLRIDVNDEAALHVYADWLQERGDTRGELITDPDALERLLELATVHGFLVLPDDPDARVLRFRSHTRADLNIYFSEHRIRWAGVAYCVRYQLLERGYLFQIEVDGREVDRRATPMAFTQPEELSVGLAIISEAILTGTPFAALEFPRYPAIREHPCYHLGRFPTSELPASYVATRPHLLNRIIDYRDQKRWFALWDRLRGR